MGTQTLTLEVNRAPTQRHRCLSHQRPGRKAKAGVRTHVTKAVSYNGGEKAADPTALKAGTRWSRSKRRAGSRADDAAPAGRAQTGAACRIFFTYFLRQGNWGSMCWVYPSIAEINTYIPQASQVSSRMLHCTSGR